MHLRRAVITGLGALTPIGNSVSEFWASLTAGRSGAASITYFDTTDFKTTFACELKNVDLAGRIEHRTLRRTDRFCQYALLAVQEAVEQAAVNFDAVDRARFGVIWASALGGIGTVEEQVVSNALSDGGPRFSAYFIPKLLADASSGLIAMEYGIHGINFNTMSACASANAALISAMDAIRLGRADMIIAGGSEAGITPAIVAGFNALKALSTRNHEPTSASRPFAVDRDGFVMGEGAGALIVEEYEHARRRGVPILAELVGGAMSADAYHTTATHPEGAGAIISMGNALAGAGLTARDIDYVNAHATSTPAGDIAELIALDAILGEHLSAVNISSTKSMTGHLLGAAGAIESIACIMAIQSNRVPPTSNTTEVDPDVPPGANLTLGRAVDRAVAVALNNSFGFGGHNATTIFARVDE